MPVILITPETKLSPDVAPVYYKFIQRRIKDNEYYLRANLNYSTPDGAMFRFSTSVLICPVMQQDAQPSVSKGGEYYQHHIGDQLGDGGFGVVLKISHTRKLGLVEFKAAGYTTKQVVKIQRHCVCSTSNKDLSKHQHNPIDVYQKKYSAFLNRIIHLGIQNPLYIPKSNTSYTVMNELFGEEVYTYLYGTDKHEPDPLSLQNRLDYCFGILRAVKEQVSDYNLIHRDLKPENIKIGVFSSPIAEITPNPVSIYDYDLAHEIPLAAKGVFDKPDVGTLSYLAPECLSISQEVPVPRLLTKKVDVFATGRILFEVLNGFDDSFAIEQKPVDYLLHLNKKQPTLISSISKKLQGLSPDHQENIKDLLRKMLELDPNRRISIEDAYSGFKDIYYSIMKTVFCDKNTNREDEFALDLLSMGSNKDDSESESESDFDKTYSRLINNRLTLPRTKSPLSRPASNRLPEHTLFAGGTILEEVDEDDNATVESAIHFTSSPASSSTASALRSLSPSPSIRLMQSRLPSIAEDTREGKLPCSPIKFRQSPFLPIAASFRMFPPQKLERLDPHKDFGDKLSAPTAQGSPVAPHGKV